jgi:hypothetical protein
MSASLPLGKQDKELLKKLIKPQKEVKLLDKNDKKIKKGEFKNLPTRS